MCHWKTIPCFLCGYNLWKRCSVSMNWSPMDRCILTEANLTIRYTNDEREISNSGPDSPPQGQWRQLFRKLMDFNVWGHNGKVLISRSERKTRHGQLLKMKKSYMGLTILKYRNFFGGRTFLVFFLLFFACSSFL